MLLLPSRAGDGATELWCALRTQLLTKLLEDALTRPLGLISEQEQSRSNCRLQQQPWSIQLHGSLPSGSAAAARCRLSLRRDDPEQLFQAELSTKTTPGACLHPRGSLRAHVGTLDAPPAPRSSGTGILDIKPAAACTRLGLVNTETKTTLHFRQNPTSLQNTCRFGVQTWGLLCLSE